MSLITLQNDQLTVTISTLGAELQSIRNWKGEEKLWHGDPQFWANRAPILFPIAGGLKDDQYTFDGQTYPMQKHGFVRKLEWQVEEASAARAVFLMTEKDPGFPFDYELRAIYELDGDKLHVTYRVSNVSSCDFAFGMGAHEAFATPEGIEAYTLLFDEPETFADYVLHGNLIAREPVIMAENTREFPLRYEYFAVDALVFPHLKSRGVMLQHNERGPVLRLEYPGHDVLMLWTKPGAGYICIEPWLNAPDFLDADGDILHKDGCVRLSPGGVEARTHTITVL